MNFVIKVADFGLAENTGSKEYYREAKNVKLPLRWMAPESMGDYMFSEKSDAVRSSNPDMHVYAVTSGTLSCKRTLLKP